MKLTEYVELLNQMTGPISHPALRRGQFMFIVLTEKYPAIADRILATDYDPFYVDKRIPKFLAYLTEFIID